MRRRTHAALLVVLLALACFPGACYSGGLVGAECGDGFTDCDGQCVDLKVDSQNCGACGVVCPDERACHQGQYCEGFDAGTGGTSNDASSSGGNSTTTAAAGAPG
jgi:hypothetical protein